MKDRYSKLAFLHRVKERKTPSLSTQASFAPFSLKVAWSGISLIGVTALYSGPKILHVCSWPDYNPPSSPADPCGSGKID